MKLRVLALLVLTLCGTVSAAQRTWDGGGGDWDWRNAVNWDGTIIRPDPINQGDTLVFPEGPTKLINTNDFGPGTNFTALIYSGDDYRTYGNRIGLSNGVSVTHASGATALHLPITLRQSQTFTVSSANAFLHLYGNVDIGLNTLTFDGAGDFLTIGEILNSRGFGRGSVRKTGSGQLTIFQPTDHDAPTIVSGGILSVDSRMTNSGVTVNSGGTLRGTGRIGGLYAASGGIVAPGGATSPDVMHCYGNAELTPGSVFRIRLNGTSVGINYDQLSVIGGTVTLGGNLEITLGYAPAVGDRFTIIENEGTDDVVGTFAGLPEGAVFTLNGRPFKISYGDRFGGVLRVNNVTIEAIPASLVWDGGGGVNNLWSQPLNWVGDIIPYPGDDLQISNFTFNSSFTTTNDFPAGRLFGSLLLGGYYQSIIGNPAQFDGRIEINSSRYGEYDIYPPLTLGGGFLQSTFGRLNFRAPVTLSGSQTFRLDYSNSRLVAYGSIVVNGHTLRVHSLATSNTYSNPSFAQFRGPVVGPGNLIKSGPGPLELSNAVSCATTVEGGTLIVGSAASIAAPLIVETGAVLYAAGGLQDVEVHAGGTFTPGRASPTIQGDVRLLSGSTLSIEIYAYYQNDTVYTASTDISVGSGHSIDITGCNLSLNISSGANRSTPLTIVRSYDLTGTFAGLPEGALFVVDNRLYSITYQSGDDVILQPINVFTWDGGGAGANWTTAANWSPEFAPLPSSHLVFGGNTSKRTVVNDFAASTRFASIRFDAAGYNISGNPISLEESLGCYAVGDVLVAADVSAGDVPIDVGSGATLQLDGVLSGYDLTKTGAGTLRLGGTIVNDIDLMRVGAGLLELAKIGTNALSGSLTVTSGVVRLLDDHQISDNAAVTVNGAGQLDVNGQTELITALSGNGTVDLSDRLLRTARLTVKRGNFAGRITGAGTFIKTSSDALVFTGVNPFVGTTVLQEGELRMDNVQTNSTIRLDGGLLTGRGFVGPITANLGGTVAPGFGGPQYESALRTRDVTFNANTTFRTVLTSSSPDFEGHKLQVAGAVNLGNCALIIDVYSIFKPTNGATWVIIENDGNDPVVGTFSGLPEGATLAGEGWLFQVSYVGGTGNDVTLKRVPAPPARLTTNLEFLSGSTRLHGFGESGLRYQLQTTTNLNPVIQWQALGEIIPDANGAFQTPRYLFPPSQQRFFRVVSQ